MAAKEKVRVREHLRVSQRGKKSALVTPVKAHTRKRPE
jgi:hypothetical protein